MEEQKQYKSLHGFQKNLVVWKSYVRGSTEDVDVRVSEELSSMEINSSSVNA